MDKYEVCELAEKALNSSTKTIQAHLAFCFLATQIAIASLQANKELALKERKKKMINSFHSICKKAVETFPEASDLVKDLEINCLWDIIINES